MPELTRDIVRSSPQFTNPLKKREISLRGMHLTQLPLTDSKLWTDIVSNFDCLDLSDNLISWLDAPGLLSGADKMKHLQDISSSSKKSHQQVPSLVLPARSKQEQALVDSEVDDFLSFLTSGDVENAPTTTTSAVATSTTTQDAFSISIQIRLSSILMHNNNLRGISKTFALQLKSSLTSLILNQNSILDFSACDIFGEFEVLERLSLVGNPVCKRENYRFYIIGTCSKTLKLLDFAKVKDAERERGQEVKKAEMMMLNQNNNNNNSSVLSTKGTVGIGGGMRAARKAAAAAAEGKRDRGATEDELGTTNISISTRIGNAVANTRKQNNNHEDEDTTTKTQETEKKYTSEELLVMLEAAETVEEMERIEALLNSLGLKL
jgi:hypothetical protein